MYKWINITTNADYGLLTALVDPEFSPGEVASRLADRISTAVKGVLVEYNYVDKDYRSTYYHFYAKKGQRYRPDCVRLHFFDGAAQFDDKNYALTRANGTLGDHYFGYMILRPTGIATVGRSLLSPDISRAKGRVMQALHKVHVLGERLEVYGFPSMDQHNDISVCAHAACWSILRHYSERFSATREFLTHDITRMAHEYNPGGLVPSRGLQLSHAERVFQEAGTFPIVVTKTAIASGASDPTFYRQLLAYVESGFPLFAAMHGRGHAIAIVGHEKSAHPPPSTGSQLHEWDLAESLIVVDDNHLPYIPVPVAPSKSAQAVTAAYTAEDIDAFIVPLPEKVFYPADAVEELIRQLWKFKPMLDLPGEDESIVRYFITTTSSLRGFMRTRASEYDPRLLKSAMVLPMAQFVWVIEIASRNDWASGNISARAVVDATASYREPLPLWLFHSKTGALMFDRNVVGGGASGSLKFAGLGANAFTRMDQNLRPIKTK